MVTRAGALARMDTDLVESLSLPLRAESEGACSGQSEGGGVLWVARCAAAGARDTGVTDALADELCLLA